MREEPLSAEESGLIRECVAQARCDEMCPQWHLAAKCAIHLDPNRLLATVDAYAVHEAATRAALREHCGDYGDNDWPDDLCLPDVIAKHLMRYVWERLDAAEALAAAAERMKAFYGVGSQPMLGLVEALAAYHARKSKEAKAGE